MSEETDAVSVVVSEETGTISISTGGKLIRNLSEESLLRSLKNIFYSPNKARGRRFFNIFSRIYPVVNEKGR